MNNTVLADTALARAVAYLERGLVRHAWSAGERLPSMLALAKAAAVSMTTMVAAVKIVRQQERLCVRRGKGIFVAAPAAYQPVVDDHTKWQRVRRRIARDILNQSLCSPGGQLSMVALQKRYDCSYYTVKKATAALIASGLLITAGNKYVVVRAQSTASRAEIVMIGIGDGLNMISFFNTRIQEFCSHAQSASGAAAIGFHRFGLRYDRTNERELLQFLQSSRSLFGIIIYLYSLPDQQIQWLVPYVAQFKVPVAILDEGGLFELPGSSLSPELYKIFTIASYKAGRAVGNFIALRGYRTLVWLADRVEVRQPWSLRRYQGLVESIVGNGLPAAAVIDAVCLADQTVAATADRENGIAAARGQSLQMLNKEIAQHLGLLVNNPLLSQVVLSLSSLSATQSHYQQMLPILSLCEGALRGETMWVCENDNRVLELLYYCRSAGITVPDTIAAIGFDDGFEASANNITSYNFDIPAIARLAVSFIVNPRHEAFTESGPVMECEGHIVERNSSRKRHDI